MISTKQKAGLPARCLDKLRNIPDKATATNIASDLIQMRKYEPEKALQAYSVNREMMKGLKVKSYVGVFNDETTTLANMRKYRGEAMTSLFVYAEMKKLAKAFNVVRGLSEDCLEEIAEMVMADYWYLKVSDLKLFRYWTINGKFGRVLDRLDISTVMQFLRDYVDGRLNSAWRKQQRDDEKELAEYQEMPDFFKKFLAEHSKRYPDFYDVRTKSREAHARYRREQMKQEHELNEKFKKSEK